MPFKPIIEMKRNINLVEAQARKTPSVDHEQRCDLSTPEINAPSNINSGLANAAAKYNDDNHNREDHHGEDHNGEDRDHQTHNTEDKNAAHIVKCSSSLNEDSYHDEQEPSADDHVSEAWGDHPYQIESDEKEDEWKGIGEYELPEHDGVQWSEPDSEPDLNIAEQMADACKYLFEMVQEHQAWVLKKARRKDPIRVQTTGKLAMLLAKLRSYIGSSRMTVIDFEGYTPGTIRTPDIMELYLIDTEQLYLIDFFILGHDAFETPAENSNWTLKDFLMSEDYQKVTWDCRNDAEHLWESYEVKLAGICDASLGVVGWTWRRRGNHHRLAVEDAIENCLLHNSHISQFEFEDLEESKRRRASAGPRPWVRSILHPALINYSHDVALMGMIWEKFLVPEFKYLPGLEAEVRAFSTREINIVCGPFGLNGQHATESPWTPGYFRSESRVNASSQWQWYEEYTASKARLKELPFAALGDMLEVEAQALESQENQPVGDLYDDDSVGEVLDTSLNMRLKWKSPD